MHTFGHDLNRYSELHARCRPAVLEFIDADHAAAYRRASDAAARKRTAATAAFIAEMPAAPFVRQPVEPFSAQAWAAIAGAYRHLCCARTASDPRMRATYLAAAANARRAAAIYRAADARLPRLA